MTDGARTGPSIRQLSSEVVYSNSWMTLREDRIERLDGSHGVYGYLERPNAVLVMPLENDGFHLVEEYRYPMRRRSWSFPQGFAPAPTLEEAARDELEQETGLRPSSMTLLGTIDVAHAISTEHSNVYLATDLTHGESVREHTEQDMRQHWVSRTEFEQMIRTGSVRDSGSLAAYTLFLLSGHA
ncbi:NUDIX domain-containing protein [Nonomuraea sp. M3C6]|uniref:NUDIX domain-containing protein n=1 Tax=Nonomuraea marmarensis TaxID=3351344 RepID=A0ABW7AGX1_9ACTN